MTLSMFYLFILLFVKVGYVTTVFIHGENSFLLVLRSRLPLLDISVNRVNVFFSITELPDQI